MPRNSITNINISYSFQRLLFLRGLSQSKTTKNTEYFTSFMSSLKTAWSMIKKKLKKKYLNSLWWPKYVICHIIILKIINFQGIFKRKLITFLNKKIIELNEKKSYSGLKESIYNCLVSWYWSVLFCSCKVTKKI